MQTITAHTGNLQHMGEVCGCLVVWLVIQWFSD
jgi:hypothetical protein